MQERHIHQLFVVSVAAKGLHAVIEIAGGLALYLLDAGTIASWIAPHEWLAARLQPSAQYFYAFYLLSHGAVKAVLVFFLLREKLWAYPASIGVFGVFIGYQLYRFTFTHEPALIFLSVFDLFVIYLAVHEYRLLRKQLPTH